MENVSLSRARALTLKPFYLFYILDKTSVLFVRWFWAPLFRASSSRSRVALCNERKRYIICRQEALSPLRLSIEGNRDAHSLQLRTCSCSLAHQVSFFLQRNISRCLSDHRMLLVLPLFPYLAKVSLCRKETEDSRGFLLQQRVYTYFFYHHRALVREAVL